MLIENKNIEDCYGMGMLCNQQNKKSLCYGVINFKNILSCFLENRQAN